MCGTVLSPLGQLCISGRVGHRISRDMGLSAMFSLSFSNIESIIEFELKYDKAKLALLESPVS
jgi:hypothetical protein